MTRSVKECRLVLTSPFPVTCPPFAAPSSGAVSSPCAVTREFIWELRYTAGQYIELLDTFSGHIDMAPWQRDRLYGEIRRRLSARPDGMLRRHWGAALQIARRLDAPRADAGQG